MSIVVLTFPIKNFVVLYKSSNFAPSNDCAFGGILLFYFITTIRMKTKILALVLGAILTMPCVLHAEEIEIQLMEVIQMGVIPGGDGPLDSSDKEGNTPTRPAGFRATIDGNLLAITKQEASIPFAQATVVNATTGSIVLNQQFTTSLSEQIGTPGVYALHIETAGGALVGQFVVQ